MGEARLTTVRSPPRRRRLHRGLRRAPGRALVTVERKDLADTFRVAEATLSGITATGVKAVTVSGLDEEIRRKVGFSLAVARGFVHAVVAAQGGCRTGHRGDRRLPPRRRQGRDHALTRSPAGAWPPSSPPSGAWTRGRRNRRLPPRSQPLPGPRLPAGRRGRPLHRRDDQRRQFVRARASDPSSRSSPFALSRRSGATSGSARGEGAGARGSWRRSGPSGLPRSRGCYEPDSCTAHEPWLRREPRREGWASSGVEPRRGSARRNRWWVGADRRASADREVGRYRPKGSRFQRGSISPFSQSA
jgi:hypothetical protein